MTQQAQVVISRSLTHTYAWAHLQVESAFSHFFPGEQPGLPSSPQRQQQSPRDRQQDAATKQPEAAQQPPLWPPLLASAKPESQRLTSEQLAGVRNPPGASSSRVATAGSVTSVGSAGSGSAAPKPPPQRPRYNPPAMLQPFVQPPPPPPLPKPQPPPPPPAPVDILPSLQGAASPAQQPPRHTTASQQPAVAASRPAAAPKPIAVGSRQL